MSRSSSGRSFQADGPAMTKARRPYVARRCLATTRLLRPAERRRYRPGTVATDEHVGSQKVALCSVLATQDLRERFRISICNILKSNITKATLITDRWRHHLYVIRMQILRWWTACRRAQWRTGWRHYRRRRHDLLARLISRGLAEAIRPSVIGDK